MLGADDRIRSHLHQPGPSPRTLAPGSPGRGVNEAGADISGERGEGGVLGVGRKARGAAHLVLRVEVIAVAARLHNPVALDNETKRETALLLVVLLLGVILLEA